MKIPLNKVQIANIHKLHFSDFQVEPIGGDNPYYKCVYCSISVPQINGDLLNHSEHCSYRREKIQNLINLKMI